MNDVTSVSCVILDRKVNGGPSVEHDDQLGFSLVENVTGVFDRASYRSSRNGLPRGLQDRSQANGLVVSAAKLSFLYLNRLAFATARAGQSVYHSTTKL